MRGEIIRVAKSPLAFIIVAVLTGIFYMQARDIMIVGNTWLYIVESNFTLNFLLFLFLCGYICDRVTKNKTKAVQWTAFAVLAVIVVIFFKFVGGFETIIG